jgi:3',5'-cyclic AMP phosphodiesterase CpdA
VTRIAHISDIHFGRIANPSIVQSLVDDINSSGADLVVVSGDITQRALPSQYEEAARMLAAFEAPYLVIAGNHDVFAWWRPHTRLLDPLRRYRKFITDDLSPRFRTGELAVFGLNTAFGATIKGGRIRREQLEEMSSWFQSEPADCFRILAIHHHVARLPDLFKHDIARGSATALDQIARSKIDLILTGHLHVSHVARLDITGRDSVVIASAGTATSDRGRKSHRAANYYNMIDVTPSAFSISEKQFDPRSESWVEKKRSEFERTFSGN